MTGKLEAVLYGQFYSPLVVTKYDDDNDDEDKPAHCGPKTLNSPKWHSLTKLQCEMRMKVLRAKEMPTVSFSNFYRLLRRKPENNSSLHGSQTCDVKIPEQRFYEKRYQNKWEKVSYELEINFCRSM